jgi:hypothetical protein
MKRVWATSTKVVTGLFVGALYATPQAYTISARPGVVNYVEGHAYLDGQPISPNALKSTFLNANDTLSTDVGKAEVLLTPGVFLRIGDNTQVRMISPSLTNTQLEVSRGEAMIEAAGLLKDNNIQVINHGASITIEKNGLYRITGDAPPSAAVIDGKAEVYFGDKKVDIGKGHEVLLSEGLKEQKFDPKKEDDLYAWSNVRSQYEAAASYQAAKNVTLNNFGGGLGGWNGYGFGGWYSPGWFWDNGFNSFAWLPGNGAFFSPFGYGFYGPGLVAYAPIIVAPVYGGGTLRNGYLPGKTTTTAAVPVNPSNPPAIGTAIRSPWANSVARTQVAQSFANSGFRTATGAHVSAGGWSGGAAHSGWSGGAAHAGSISGGAAHAGGFSGGAAAHSAGGGAHK